MRQLFLLVILSLLLAVAFFAGVSVGITLASASRSPLVMPSASPRQSDRAATGAPNETARVLPSSVGAPPSPSAVSVRGTWYCNADPTRGPLSRCTRGYPDGPGPDLFAAVSPDLAHLRGQAIRVCLAARCVDVRAIDCMCSGRAAVDLYADAFEALAPLWVGRLYGGTVRTWTLVP